MPVWILPVEDIGNYSVVGDATGIVPIKSVVFTSDPVVAGSPATGHITITFGVPGSPTTFFLPDDRYTLTISDNVVDPTDVISLMAKLN